MPIASKYAGKCYDCGTEYKVGDQISTNGKKSKNGKDHWCPNGTNCQGKMQLEGSIKPTNDPITEPTSEQLLAVAKDLLNGDRDNTVENIDEFVKRVHNLTLVATAKKLIQKAAIDTAMDIAEIKHPSRVAFTHEVMEDLRQ